MSSVTNVGIKLTLDGAAQAEAGLRRVQGGMAALGTTAESVRGAMQQLAGAFAGVVSVRAFVQAADAVTQLQNQLRLATGSTQAATAAYQQLFEIAQRSRVSFTELGGTFATITRATESLGLSQQQLLGVTEAIGNAITVSGSSAAASQAALVQLGQGLAAGALRGEELNSILEQTPRLARALADGLGVSVGQLRKLGEEGKLTAEAVIAALQSQASVLANEVTSSVVTVGQAFTQLQNSATALVGEIDRVSGSSATLAGVVQAASESLDNIARAFRDTQSEGQQVNVFADAIAVVFETVAVIGVNVAYVIKQIGVEIGGLAAQAAAVARLDFSAAREIGRLMREDAAAARREVDALSERILNQRRLAEQARQSLQGVDTRAEDARLARLAQSATSAFSKIVTGSNEAKKAADDFAKSVERGVKLYGDLTAQDGGLAADFAEQWKDLSAAFQAGKINLEQLTAAQALLLEQQPFAKELAKEQAEALKQQAKAAEDLAKAEFERIEALERNAASAEEQLQRLLDEERTLVIAAERNITLAQAIEEVAIARLREQQAALMREGDRDAEVLAIQREIDARKKLAEAIGRKEARDAATESAKDAAREWERTAENIERSLTDALLRGFESGKDFARNLRDTVVNMFQSMVLRPVIQAVVAPVAGGLTSMFGLPGTANAGQLGNSMGIASGIKSVYDTIVGGFTSLGNSVAFAAQDIGAWLVNNTTGVLNRFGGSLMSNAGTLGTVGSYLGGVGAGLALGNLISGGYSAIGKSGNTANVAGTAIGAFFGGPIGAAIGGAIGGLVNRAFGRKAPVTTGSGIIGTFSTEGADVQQYQEWFSKGGWFRSDKSGVNYSAVSAELDDFLDQSLRQITMATKMYASVLGLNADAVNGITQSVKISLMGLNAEQQQEAVLKALSAFGDRLADAYVNPFRRASETSGEALARLANSLVTVNQVFDTLNQTLLHASLVGGDAASKLLDAFGGADAFTQSTSAYYQAFYSDAERVDTATRQLSFALESMGLVLPRTRAEFRALVEAQDLYSDSGRQTYAALLKLAPVFNEIQTAAESFANAFEAALRGVFDGLNESVRRTRQSVASAREDIAGRAIMDPDQIRNAIQAAMVTAPSTSGLTAADALVANRQGSVNTLTGLSDAANATAQQQLAALQARQAELAGAQQSLANLDASRQARRDEFNRIWLGRIGSYRWRLSLGDVYRQEEAQYQQQAEGLRAYIAALSGAVATQQSIYDTAAASAANYSAQLTAAQAALESSLAAQQTAREQYAASVREYIAAAGRSVETLSSLRQSVVDYYESQRELAEAMLGSAARLRDAAGAVRFGQLSAQEASGQLLAQFQQDYSMALATTGVTRAQYADRLASALPQLSESLRSSSMTREDWIVATARLVGQANTVASLLEQSAPRDYEAESLALLGDIDQALASIEASAASAEKIISDAIYETGAQNLTGLRAIVATLRGESAPRFALGGQHAGGIRLVGENGPELEVTGPARYWSYEQTRRLMGGASSDEATANEVRALREEQRAQAGAMVALQQRFIKLLERWDVQGLPEERVTA